MRAYKKYHKKKEDPTKW